MTSISLIIPVFNAENYLEACLKSAVEQTFTDFEIFVIDDASTDSSLSIIKVFQKEYKNINILQLEENKGSGYCRNLAIKKAQGKYLMFLDADDYLEEDALEMAFQSIEKEKCSLVLFGYKEFWQSSQKTTEYTPTASSDELKNKSFELFLMNRKGFTPVPWSYIYDRKFILKNNIKFTEGIYFEDLEFVSKAIFFAKRITSYTEKPFYNYRRHKMSATLKHSECKIFDMLCAYEKLESFLKEQKVLEKCKKEHIARVLVFCICNVFQSYFRLKEDNVSHKLEEKINQIRTSKLLYPRNLQLVKEILKEISANEKKIEILYSQSFNYLNKLTSKTSDFLFEKKLTNNLMGQNLSH